MSALPRNQNEFERRVALAQEIQRRNPYGSRLHRAAYLAIRRAVLRYTGKEIGEYE
jgi:hypothetical protein